MNSRILIAVLVWGATVGMTQAADVAAGPTNFSSCNRVSAGRNIIALAPDFDRAMADRLKVSFENIPGVSHVKPYTGDSSVHFIVAKGAQVCVDDLQKAVAEAQAQSGDVATRQISEGL